MFHELFTHFPNDRIEFNRNISYVVDEKYLFQGFDLFIIFFELLSTRNKKKTMPSLNRLFKQQNPEHFQKWKTWSCRANVPQVQTNTVSDILKFHWEESLTYSQAHQFFFHIQPSILQSFLWCFVSLLSAKAVLSKS